MAAMRERLMEGMAERGITGETAEEIAGKLEAFAHFGFPESHSVSFAYLVYASSWVKRRYPAEFACALLNAQPMGFYSPHTIVRDAVRHGVEVLGPCVNASRRDCTLEPRTAGSRTDRAPAARVARRPVDARGAHRPPLRARSLQRSARSHRRGPRRFLSSWARRPVPRPGGLHPAHERARRRARVARHRGCVRVPGRRPARRVVGRRCAPRRTIRAPSPGS